MTTGGAIADRYGGGNRDTLAAAIDSAITFAVEDALNVHPAPTPPTPTAPPAPVASETPPPAPKKPAP